METIQKDLKLSAEITKIDSERRIVYGWASVIEKDGKPVVDDDGDMIAEADLVKAAHKFVADCRMAKAMHKGDQIGEFVESLVFTYDVQKALGIDLKKVGWFVGLKVESDAVWKMVKEGKLKMFSIGGRGNRVDNGA